MPQTAKLRQSQAANAQADRGHAQGDRRRQSRFVQLAPWLAIAVIFLFWVPYFPKIRSANELPRVYLVKAMVDHGTFAIDDGVARWGTTADVSPAGGHHYSNKAPGSSMLAAPFYWVAKSLLGRPPSLWFSTWLCRVTTGIVPTLLLLLCLPRLLRRYLPLAAASGNDDTSREAAIRLTVLAYALGSMAMTYSVLFISHQLSAVVIAIGWLWLQDGLDAAAAGEVRHGRWLAAGLLLGAAPLVDYQALFAGVPLGLWLLWQLRSVVLRGPAGRRLTASGAATAVALAVAGAMVPIAILLAYHASCFGSPWKTGYDASESFAHFHQQGFLGITTLRREAFWGATFAGDNGLFTLAPWLLGFLPGVWLLRRYAKSVAWLSASVVVIYLLFISSINFWRGGWCVGPRYITVMLPFMLPAIATWLQFARSQRRAGDSLAIGSVAAVLVGVFVYCLATATYPHFPDRYSNPIWDISIALVRDAAVAPSWLAMGTGFGAHVVLAAFGLLVFGVVLPVVRAYLLPTRWPWLSVALAFGLAAAVVFGYRDISRASPADAAAYRNFVLPSVREAPGSW